MPNWCENDLYITGPRDEVGKFLKKCRKNGKYTLDFNDFIPYPRYYGFLDKERKIQERMLENSPFYPYFLGVRWFYLVAKDGYNQGGYEWCWDNWGTKWNACEVEFHVENDIIVITFSTAWEPPKPVIEAISREFPELRLQLYYYEGGGGFKGEFVCEDGEVVVDMTDEYDGDRGG